MLHFTSLKMYNLLLSSQSPILHLYLPSVLFWVPCEEHIYLDILTSDVMNCSLADEHMEIEMRRLNMQVVLYVNCSRWSKVILQFSDLRIRDLFQKASWNWVLSWLALSKAFWLAFINYPVKLLVSKLYLLSCQQYICYVLIKYMSLYYEFRFYFEVLFSFFLCFALLIKF